MGEDTLIFENLSEHLYRTGKRVPPISRSRVSGSPEAVRNGGFCLHRYGNWNTVYKRFNRWSAAGVFEKLFEHFSRDRDLEYLLIDSTIVRAHACSSGAQKKKVNNL